MTWSIYKTPGPATKGWQIESLICQPMRSKHAARGWLEIDKEAYFNRAVFMENENGKRIWPGKINNFWRMLGDLIWE